MVEYIKCPCCKRKGIKMKGHKFCENCFKYTKNLNKRITYYKGQVRKLKNGEKSIKFDTTD